MKPTWTYRMWDSLRKMRRREMHGTVKIKDGPLIARVDSAIRYLEARNRRKSL